MGPNQPVISPRRIHAIICYPSCVAPPGLYSRPGSSNDFSEPSAGGSEVVAWEVPPNRASHRNPDLNQRPDPTSSGQSYQSSWPRWRKLGDPREGADDVHDVDRAGPGFRRS